MEGPHPGISVHRIPVGSGIMGFLFAAGSMLIFLVGIPGLWVFLGGAVALGVGFAFVLRLLDRRDAK